MLGRGHLDPANVTATGGALALNVTRLDGAEIPLYLNAWYPAWLAGTPSPSGAATLVDPVTVTP